LVPEDVVVNLSTTVDRRFLPENGVDFRILPDGGHHGWNCQPEKTGARNFPSPGNPFRITAPDFSHSLAPC